MNDRSESDGRTPTSDSPCAGCASLDRRGFLNTASVLSLGALLAACGDGVISGPEAFLDILREPLRVDPRLYPELQQVGGRVVITPAGLAPMVVENAALAGTLRSRWSVRIAARL